MFRSATFKLTSWYLAIIMAVSVLFSIVIYTTASNEIVTRLDDWQPLYDTNKSALIFIRDHQIHQAEANLIISLAISNIAIWTLGGIGSYYLARRSLRPIEEAHEAQSRFTSDASHELRTPLASMTTEIEVALRDPKLSKMEMRELLKSNLEEVNKLTKLSQTLLQLSRMDHGNIARERVSLRDATKSVVERFDKTGKRIKLSGQGQFAVLANKSSIEELLTILIDNALKYSPTNSEVFISLITKKQFVGFEITNAGDGIPPEVLPHIFDRFYRADTSRSNSSKNGYGLGLALAKKIVELNGGELSVSSAIGADTTFRVFLQKLSRDKAKNQS
jgi:two-component system sensor histidine kinase CiaH